MSDGAENDAYLDLVESEVGRAVEQARVEGGIAELDTLRGVFSAIRSSTSATSKRNAYGVMISAIDARLAVLRTQAEGLG